MKTRLLLAALLAAMLTACSSGPIHLAKIDSAVQLYAAAIRFGEYEKAQEFVEPSRRKPLDLIWLKDVHVSSYDIIYRKENLGGNIYEMKVQIRYFLESEGVEKSIIDNQVWRYDPDKQKMILLSGLPEFH